MILVTGATGLLGIYLLMELSEKETKKIKATFRSETKKQEAKDLFFKYNNYSNTQENWNKIIWIKTDITNIPELDLAFDSISEVYHCAGYISFITSEFEKLKKINIEGTANVVNMALKYSVEKFCHVSSISTLNLAPGETTFNEKSNWNPELKNTVYAISKFGGEMEVWRGIQEGLNAVIVKPGVIIGSGFFNTGSSKIFKNTYNGIPFYTTGKTGYISILDCVKTMHFLMINSLFNDSFILVSENKTHKEVIDTICSIYNHKLPKRHISKKLLKPFAYTEDILNKTFNYTPKIPLEIIDSLFNSSEYINTKITNVINWEFEQVDNTLKKVSADYYSSLSDNSSSSDSLS